jgi:hypothetical protein
MGIATGHYDLAGAGDRDFLRRDSTGCGTVDDVGLVSGYPPGGLITVANRMRPRKTGPEWSTGAGPRLPGVQ